MSLFTLLINRYWRADEADPHWPDRDRLVVSGTAHTPPPKGAVAMDGPPGLAVGVAAGMAIAERLLNARFGRTIVDHRTWLLAQPQDLLAGPAQETVGVASALRLARLTVLAAMPQRDPRLLARIAAAGWMVRTVQAGDEREAESALSAVVRSQKPTLIVETGRSEAGRSEAGRSEPSRPGSRAEDGAGAANHDTGKEQEADDAETGPATRRAWLKRLRRHHEREAFAHALSCHYPPGWHRAAYADEAQPDHAGTPEAGTLRALGRLAATLPELAELPHRETQALAGQTRPAFPVGPTTVWDGLDQAAWACAAGMALHGGLLPVLRCTRRQAALAGPALRLVAQKSARLLQIVAADEDDEELPPVPTGAGILTPYDSAEALDCLVLALRQPASPSILVLPPPLSLSMPPGHRLSARGGYLVHDADRRDVTLLVAGAFMAVAAAVRTALVAQGLDAALVSIPSRSLFAAQDATYQGMVLGSALRVYFGGAVRFAGLAGLADMVVEPNPTEDTARLVHRIRARLDAAAAMLEAS